MVAAARDGPLRQPGGLHGAAAWIITDGKAGDLVPCLGVAEALGLAAEQRVVRPRAPWVWLAPFGPTDPLEAPGRAGGPLAPPYPDIAIASGRRAVPALLAVKQASQGRCFTVFLKMPRRGNAADLVWVPEHDPLRGPNVFVTLTSPSRLTPAGLAAARAAPDPRLARLPAPRVAMVLGGPGARFVFDQEMIDTLIRIARTLLAENCSLMVTPSRRSPAALVSAFAALAAEAGDRMFVWQGQGPNPYTGMLALAEAIVVTADSVNMLGEATLTGAPVHVVEPWGGHPKVRWFVDRLVAHGAVRRWAGRLEHFAYVPLDATPVIADEIARRYAAFRQDGPSTGPRP